MDDQERKTAFDEFFRYDLGDTLKFFTSTEHYGPIWVPVERMVQQCPGGVLQIWYLCRDQRPEAKNRDLHRLNEAEVRRESPTERSRRNDDADFAEASSKARWRELQRVILSAAAEASDKKTQEEPGL